jgi:hypothetical protein
MTTYLDTYNKERSHLSLEDTNDLLRVQDLIERDLVEDALDFLTDFIAVRGYDENPVIESVGREYDHTYTEETN